MHISRPPYSTASFDSYYITTITDVDSKYMWCISSWHTQVSLNMLYNLLQPLQRLTTFRNSIQHIIVAVSYFRTVEELVSSIQCGVITTLIACYTQHNILYSCVSNDYV